MPPPDRALELEHQAIAGEPALGEAVELLRDAWQGGERDRELALHLMLLAWYVTVEPEHLTGLDVSRISASELSALFVEAHDWLDPVRRRDGEALYVVGLMAHMCPWCIQEEAVELWEERSRQYRAAYRELAPDGIDPEVFDGRGFYGDYFAGHARLKDAY